MKLKKAIFILILGTFVPKISYGAEFKEKSSLEQIPQEIDDSRHNNITKQNSNKETNRIDVVHNKTLDSNNVNPNGTKFKIRRNSKVIKNLVKETFLLNSIDTKKSQNSKNSVKKSGTTKQLKETTIELANNINKYVEKEINENQYAQYNDVQDNINTNASKEETPDKLNLQDLEAPQDVIIINLEPINKMGFVEFLGKKMQAIWNGRHTKTDDSFVGRCIGMARKLKMMMPWIMMGMGAIATKLAFLLLFSMKSLALLGLLVIMNVATGAAKLGALFASKKHDSKPQVMHFHVHPDAIDHHGPHSSGGYWEDRNDFLDINKLQRKDLYNLYDKLKAEEYYRKQQYLYSIKR